MKHIEISERTLHFKQPAGTSRGVYTTRQSYYLTITDDDRPGIKGVGECATLPDLSCDAVPEYFKIPSDICRMVEQTGNIPYEMLRPWLSFNIVWTRNSFCTIGSKRFYDFMIRLLDVVKKA